MKVLYFDCSMGAAGDMLAASLLHLADDPQKMLTELNEIGIPAVRYAMLDSEKCGIRGIRLSVTVNGTEEDEASLHPHHHCGIVEIRELIGKLNLSDKIKNDILAVYGILAEAESAVHGEPVSEIHFHEVGMLDAVADIAAVCFLLDRIAPDFIAASAVHTGSGTVRCAHGVLPVPAPATAAILKKIPIYGGEIEGELCTPTGAALLKYFVQDFGSLPELLPEKIGYGMGKKDFERPNCVRALLGKLPGDVVCELLCNLDDMTGEELGFALETLMEEGALDAYTLPVGMKKSRPGMILGVLCRKEDREKMLEILFRHTTTLGVRETVCRRYLLKREVNEKETDFGPVRYKTSFGYGTEKIKYEFDDLARIARKTGMSLREVKSHIDS